MHLTKIALTTLRSRIQVAIRRADELTTELCPSPTRWKVAADVTAVVDLMIADAVEDLSSAGHALSIVEPEFPADGSEAKSLAPNHIALIARAEQKTSHAIDMLNHAQQMVEGERSIWGQEIRHGSLYYK